MRSGDENVSAGDNGNRWRQSSVNRRRLLQTVGSGALTAGLAGCLGAIPGGNADSTFKVGINVELSQGYSNLGGSVVNAAKLHGNKINDAGGLDGKQIEFIVEDNQVDPKTAVDKARKLTQQDNVDIIFGPINSSQRVAIADIARQAETPLIYPIPYEGTVADDYCNPYIIKLGQIPEQQVIPFVKWLQRNHGDKFFLLGADYTWPRQLNKYARETLEANGGTVVGEEYVQVNSTDFSSIIPRIENQNPDVFFMDLVGSSVAAIQKQMYNRGVRGSWQDVGMAHGLAELSGTSIRACKGVLNSQAYFETLPNDLNQQFVKNYRDEYGDDALIAYLTGTSYAAFTLLQKAVKKGGGTSADQIVKGFRSNPSAGSVLGPISVPFDQQLKVGCHVGEVVATGNGGKKYKVQKKLKTVMPNETCSDF